MDEMRLKMNRNKTEIINFGSRHQLRKCCYNELTVRDDKISYSEMIKYVGAWLD